MSFIPDRYRDLKDLVRRSRGHEVDEEFEAHLAMRAEELVATGLSPEEAVAEAQRRFGNVAHYRAQTDRIDRVARGRAGAAELGDMLTRELRGALRRLVRQPTFTVTTTLTLALGIAAATVVFAILDAVALRPLPYPAADRLVYVTHPVPGVGADQQWQMSQAGYYHLVRHSTTLDAAGAFFNDFVPLFADGEAERTPAVFTTSSMLGVLGVTPLLGRYFTDDEALPAAAPVAVLTHALWQRRFGGDPAIVGKTIEISSRQAQVIGVLPPGAEFPNRAVDLWLPLRLDPNAPPMNSHQFGVYARLRPGVLPATAERELAGFISRWTEEYPSAYSPAFMNHTGFGARITPLRDELLGSASRTLWLLFGAMAVVLLIAVANVSNLLVARFESRARDVALRTALGARRSQLAIHFLAEGFALAALAAAVALMLAVAALPAVVAAAPFGIPRLERAVIDWRVFAWLASLSVTLGVALGAVPLFRLRGPEGTIVDGGRSATAGRSRTRMRSGLVVAQVALSLVLLAGAGLLTRTALHLREVPLGFVADDAFTFDVALAWATYNNYERVATYHRTLSDRLLALPGVRSVGATTTLPLSDWRGCASLFIEGRPVPAGETPPCVGNAIVGPGAFEALGMQVRGRARSWSDEDAQSDAVVISAALARRLWPGEDPIGKGIRGNGDTPPYYRVVGVAEDIRGGGLEQPPLEVVYYPMRPMAGTFLWDPPRNTHMVVRTNGASWRAVAAAVQSVVAEIDPRVPVANLRLLEAQVERAMARTNFLLVLLALAASMAVLIAAVGLYGVVSYAVTQRQRELGVRLALGATGGRVRALILRESLLLALVGVAIGMGGAWMVTRLLTAVLFGVSPLDPFALGSAGALLLAVAAVASALPAWRAAHADPAAILRGD